MKFSLSWLKQYLVTEATVEEISARLNAIGIEVEGIENPADRLAGFRVARVLTAARHPDADKLQVLTVDASAFGSSAQMRESLNRARDTRRWAQEQLARLERGSTH